MPKVTRKLARKSPAPLKHHEKLSAMSQLPEPNTKAADDSTTDELKLKIKELVTSLKYAGRAAKVLVYFIIAQSRASCVPASTPSPL